MAIDMKNEDVRDLSYAASNWVPQGVHSISTLWRWANKGLMDQSGTRIKLEVIRIGRKVMTSQKALQRFFERTNGLQIDEIESHKEPAVAYNGDETSRLLSVIEQLQSENEKLLEMVENLISGHRDSNGELPKYYYNTTGGYILFGGKVWKADPFTTIQTIQR
jgi:hypothetical protein